MRRRFLSFFLGALCMGAALASVPCFFERAEAGGRIRICLRDLKDVDFPDGLFRWTLKDGEGPEPEAAAAEEELLPVYVYPGVVYLFGEPYRLFYTDAGSPAYRSAFDEVPSGTDAGREELPPLPWVLAAAQDAVFSRIPKEDRGNDLAVCEAISLYLSERLSYADRAAERIETEAWAPGDEDTCTFWSLADGQAVCSGYAECFQRLCWLNGIECWYVTGWVPADGGLQYHAWNYVRGRDGQCWWVDPTFGDCEEGEGEGESSFVYSDRLWNGYTVKSMDRRYERINGTDCPYTGDLDEGFVNSG